ncbi:MAG: hypothetical protein FWC77_00515 [Defluviitaleaceae bacterium]|nr:hypothetical protein [Defluviitaleaceae bacterium]
MKKMYIFTLLMVLGLVLLTACGGNGGTANNAQNDNTEDFQATPPEYESSNGQLPNAQDVPETNDDYYSSNDDTAPPYTGTQPEPAPEPTAPPEDNSNNDTTSHHTGGVALGLTIERLGYEEGPGQLAGLDFMHTIDLGHGSPEASLGDNLMIRTYTHLREFAVITMENDMANDEVIFIPAAAIGETVNDFLPGEGFIIFGYMSTGTLPSRAITFLDESGRRWHFAIQQNQAYPYEGDAYMLIPLASSYPYQALTFEWAN